MNETLEFVGFQTKKNQNKKKNRHVSNSKGHGSRSTATRVIFLLIS